MSNITLHSVPAKQVTIDINNLENNGNAREKGQSGAKFCKLLAI